MCYTDLGVYIEYTVCYTVPTHCVTHYTVCYTVIENREVILQYPLVGLPLFTRLFSEKV